MMRTRGTVPVGEARIEYVAQGVGDTVALLPMGGLDGDHLEDFAARLARGGFSVLIVNPRGVGGSVGPLDGVTLHTLAADAAAVIERVAPRPVHVVGHGFSNRVARCLAVDRPDLVRSLTLLAGVGLIDPTPEVVRALRAWFREDATEAECLAALRCLVGDPAAAPRILRAVRRWPAAAAAQAEAGRATALDDLRWEATRAPVLIVQGLADPVAPPAHGRAVREQVGDRVEVVEIPAAGHLLVLEEPHAVAEAVLEFLRDRAA